MPDPGDEYKGEAQAGLQTYTINAQELRDGLTDSVTDLMDTIDGLNALIALPNATINANPAATIKSFARDMRWAIKEQIRIARLVSRQTDSTDLGDGS